MRKLNVSVIIGIVVALVGAGLVFAYGHNVNNKISSGKHPMSVLVADQALTAGTTASDVASHVHIAQIPAAYVVQGALTTPAALTRAKSSSAVLAGGVPQGGQLSLSDFAAAASTSQVQPAKGDVALSVETPLSSGVARYLEPGQLVDVFATYSGTASSGGNQRSIAKTKLFASGVKVLAVTIAAPPANTKSDSDSTDSSDASQPSGTVIVLLDLSPANAEKVVNATTLGSIYLAYTPSRHAATTHGATPQSVLSSNK